MTEIYEQTAIKIYYTMLFFFIYAVLLHNLQKKGEISHQL